MGYWEKVAALKAEQARAGTGSTSPESRSAAARDGGSTPPRSTKPRYMCSSCHQGTTKKAAESARGMCPRCTRWWTAPSFADTLGVVDEMWDHEVFEMIKAKPNLALAVSAMKKARPLPKPHEWSLAVLVMVDERYRRRIGRTQGWA